MSYRDLELKVIGWASARKIIPNSTPAAQSRKTLEEAGELLEAATAIRVCNDLVKLRPELADDPAVQAYRAEWVAKFKDAVGDVQVTMINACALADVDMVDCLAGSWDEIKDRTGTLLPSGVFVKDQA